MVGPRLRNWLTWGASAAAGVATASALASALGPRWALVLPEAPKPISVPVRIAVAARSSSLQDAAAAQAIVPLYAQTATATQRPRSGNGRQAQAETQGTAHESDAIKRTTDVASVLDDSRARTEQSSEVLEAFDIGEPELKTYPEIPGGNVLVLGLLVNEHGVVLDSRVLVPSYNQLADLSVAMAAVGQVYKPVHPPLRRGETRWIELRIPFKPENSRQDILP